jgi:hypothetical protein
LSENTLPATVPIFTTTALVGTATASTAGTTSSTFAASVRGTRLTGRGRVVAGRVGITVVVGATRLFTTATTVITTAIIAAVTVGITVRAAAAATTTVASAAAAASIFVTGIATVVTATTATTATIITAAVITTAIFATVIAAVVVGVITAAVATAVVVVIAATPGTSTSSGTTAVIVAVSTTGRATGSTRAITLGGTEVLSGCRSARTAATRLLDAQGTALDDLALEALLGCVGLLGSNHVDEAEATGLLGVGVQHDRAVIDITVLLEETRNVGFGQAWVDASDEQVGAAIKGTFLFLFLLQVSLAQGARTFITVVGAAVGGTAASAITSGLIARRGAAVAVVPGLVGVTAVIVVVISHDGWRQKGGWGRKERRGKKRNQ